MRNISDGAQTVLPGMPRRLLRASPKSLADFSDCPRRYRYANIDRPTPPRGPRFAHHTVGTADGRRAREWVPTLLTHHFPLRARRRTEEKLRRAMTPDGRYATSPDGFTRDRILERLRALDDLYAGRYERVASGFAGDRRMGITVSDWRALVSPLERATAYGGAPVAHQADSSGLSHA